MAAPRFDDGAMLKYLGHDSSYTPSPVQDPIGFLNKNLTYLPPHLAGQFSQITTPKQRTVIPVIRNRRLRYVDSGPAEFSFQTARTTWPSLWQGQETRDMIQAEGKEEEDDGGQWSRATLTQVSCFRSACAWFEFAQSVTRIAKRPIFLLLPLHNC